MRKLIIALSVITTSAALAESFSLSFSPDPTPKDVMSELQFMRSPEWVHGDDHGWVSSHVGGVIRIRGASDFMDKLPSGKHNTTIFNYSQIGDPITCYDTGRVFGDNEPVFRCIVLHNGVIQSTDEGAEQGDFYDGPYNKQETGVVRVRQGKVVQ